MPLTKNVLRVVPNPFAFLDHEGLPAATFPIDPIHHSPDRRWVGAIVDRSLAADGLPKTRPLPQPGDLIAVIRDTRPGAAPDAMRRVHVDRAERKRIVWAHAVDVTEPHVVPISSHYLMGLRQGDLIAADEATAKAANLIKPGAPFVPPAQALRAAADKAITDWANTYGEPPDVDAWPDNLRAVAGLSALAAPPPASSPQPGAAS
jgi:hypothetical protein